MTDKKQFVSLLRKHDRDHFVLGHQISREEFNLVLDTREEVVSARWDSGCDEIIDLHNVSFAFPSSLSNPYDYVLEHSISRDWIGYVSGRKQYRFRMRKGAYVSKSALLEYACAFIHGRPDCTFEYFHFQDDRDRVTIFHNGEKLGWLTFPVLPLRSFKSLSHPQPRELFVDDERIGVVRDTGLRWSVNYVLQLDDGPTLPIPLTWGVPSKEAVAIIFRVLTLKPLWSSDMPPNLHRVIDPSTAGKLGDRETYAYFATALFMFCSVLKMGHN